MNLLLSASTHFEPQQSSLSEKEGINFNESSEQTQDDSAAAEELSSKNIRMDNNNNEENEHVNGFPILK